MKYEDMSDFDISSMVLAATAGGLACNLRRHKLHKLKVFSGTVLFDMVDGDDILDGKVNYCKNPSDAWPIIVDNDITVSPSEGAYIHDGKSHGYNDDSHEVGKIHECEHENPLRAAMIVFLMMKDANNV